MSHHPERSGRPQSRRKGRHRPQSTRAARLRPDLELIEPRVLPTGTITGIVFRDYNASGAQDAYEPGVGGITVSAYDENENLVATTTTSTAPATLGQYTLPIPGASIRQKVEFTNIPAGFLTGPSGPGSGTTNVQYTNTSGGTASASLGINRPSQYTLPNPNIAVVNYAFGASNGAFATRPVITSYPYLQTGDQTTNPPTTLATAGQVGSVYGLAYRAATNTVYASAFQKFATGYGPNGTGAIYAVNGPGPGSGAVSLLVDLNAVFGANTAGANPHTNPDYSRDTPASFAAAGKTSLGGMAISEDGSTLYVMNLANRRLYSIPIANPTATGITSYPIPIPASASNANDVRPFAVAVNDGQVYVGMVDSAQTTQNAADLKAYVYSFNPVTNTFGAAPALQMPLNFTRDYADAYSGGGPWRPWTDTFSGAFSVPQPELAGLAFDNGAMILGFRDRYGDQEGQNTFNPSNPADPNSYFPIPAGDLLRASPNAAGGWTIENNATATGPTGTSITTAGANNNAGPGGGRYYYQQNFEPNHRNTSLGGVLQLPGVPTVLTTAFDPTVNLFSGGTRVNSNLTGANIQGYQLYANTGGTFGKANGVGGVVALNPLAPLEIGGRVFNDPNFDGIKSAGEFGTVGATVSLYRGATLVGTTTTGVGGIYTFNASNVAGGIVPGVAYQVRLDRAADFAAGGVLAGTFLTRQAQDPRGLSGSKAVLSGVVPVINVTAGGPGSNDESNYFGLVQASSLSGSVYFDASNDGIRQATEAGIAGATVTITGGNLATPLVLTTDANGLWTTPTTLAPGTYNVTLAQPAGFLPGKSTIGSQGGTNQSPTVLTATLAANTAGTNNNFGELLPASVAGTVYLDANKDGTLNAGDSGIAGVAVALTGTNDLGAAVNLVATTDANGAYLFNGLRPGTYTLTETQPASYVNGANTPGSLGGTATAAAIAAIGVGPGNAGIGYNFGEQRPTVSGIIFVDANRNGVRDPLEAGSPGVTVNLVDPATGTVVATTTTSATGVYIFPNVPTGNYNVVEVPPPGYGTDTPTVVPVALTTAATTPVNFGLTTASLAGIVYNDVNANLILEGTDFRLGGVLVALTGTDVTGAAVNLTTTTAADGSYLFPGLLSGTYTVTVNALASLAPELPTAGTAGGTPAFSAAASSIGAITLGAGVSAVNYLFPEAGAVLSGVAFVDANGNGALNVGEAGVAGVLVTLTNATTGAIVDTTTTGPGGRYSFGNVAPGTYRVTETPPAGYGTSTPQTLTVFVTSGSSQTGNNFGLTTSSLAGNVYVDRPNAGVIQAGDPPIAGVTVTLTGTDATGAAVNLTTVTAADGSYLFANLLAGTYTVTEAQPAAYGNGATTPGSAGGTAGVNTVTGIALAAATAATGYNFGELGATVTGSAFVDANRDGVRQAGEPALGGETITLLDAAGNVVATTTTAPDGTYSFIGLPAGSYTVVETTPPGYGTSSPTAVPVTPVAGGVAPANFGLTTAALSGVVYVDANNNGTPDAGEAPLAGITLILTGTDAAGNPVTRVTQTAADGSYAFLGLLSGTYTVTEQTPAAYTTGKSSAGAAGGTPGVAVVSAITPDPGQVAPGYNFGELGAAISGVVFTDVNRDTAYQRNEPTNGGVTVTLLNSAGTVIATTTTAPDGTYSFANLPAGNYTVVETPPPGYGPETPTVLPVALPLTGLANQDFDLILASIAGHVYLDNNASGVYQAGNPGIAGVTVTLTGTDATGAAVNLTTVTAADGSYLFANLLAGTYTVTEAQPAIYNQAATTAGSAGGAAATDVISAVALAGGVAAFGYDFGEAGTALAGAVYVDANRNGVFDPGEAPRAGVPITLRNSGGVVVGQTTTAIDGTYIFSNLAAGNYTIQEGVQPGYGDSTAPFVNAAVPLTGLAGQNFGLTTSSLIGAVYLDRNLDQVLSAGDVGVAGQVVSLFGTAFDGSAVQLQTTTDANGNYAFVGILSGNYTVVLAQPANYTYEVSNPGSAGGTAVTLAITNFSVGSNLPPTSADLTAYNFGLVGSAITGTMFVDADGDGVPEPGNPPVAGATVTLLDSAGNVVATTATAADGTYSFPGLPAGNYTVVGTPPAGYGTASPTSVPVTLAAGGVPVANFAVTTTTISGTVYFDADRSGTISVGDSGIAGVTVTLTGGNLAAPLTAVTDAGGNYTFTGLLAGTYTVTEAQPVAYGQGTTTPGSAGGTAAGDVISSIALPTSGATGYNFGEVGAALAGSVYVDADRNGVPSVGDSGRPGVVLTLLDANGAVVATTTTNADGSYAFFNLPAGNYSVVETLPATNGAATPTTVAVAVPTTGLAGVNFGLTANTLAGTVYLDTNGDGVFNNGEVGLAGVTITLTGTDATGAPVNRTTTTGADGSYSFANLPVGSYTLVETQPSQFSPGAATPGSAGGIAAANTIANVALAPNVQATGYNFGNLGTVIQGVAFLDANGNAGLDAGEAPVAGVVVTLLDAAGNVVATTTTAANGSYQFASLPAGNYTVVETPPAGYGTNTPTSVPVTLGASGAATANFGLTNTSIAGTVYVDADGSGTLTAADRRLAGVTVTLTGGNLAAPRTTTTDAQGNYSFTGLLAGTYTLTESQPAGYGEGATTAGSAGGAATTNVIAAIALPAGVAATGYNFGEVTGGLLGTVFVDANRDGALSPGEAGRPGVVVTLLDAAGNVVATTTTAADGSYQFPNLPTGAYTVVETPPPGFGVDSPVRVPVTIGGATPAIVGFGLTTSQLSGVAYVDANDNGRLDPGEAPLGGVTIGLVGTDAVGQPVSLLATTAADGSYLFDGLLSGTYTVVAVPPAGYLPGSVSAGTAGGAAGADRTTGVPLGAGVQATAYNFGELRPAAIVGTVYRDGNANGVIDAGDAPLAGVTVSLTGTDDRGAAVALTTTTDAGGNYAFVGLRPGTYAVVEAAPAGYSPGTATPGSAGGSAAPRAIGGIVLAQGTVATANNFGELQAALVGTVRANGFPVAGAQVVVTDPAGNVLGVATTGADGTYVIPGLPAGPANVTASIPSPGGAPIVQSSGVTMTGGATTTQDFQATTQAGSVSGSVYTDNNNNGAKDPGEAGVGGVPITLTGTDTAGNPVTQTTTTAPDGSYTFPGVPAGTYTVTESTPAGGTLPGRPSVGTLGGTPGTRAVTGVTVGSGAPGTGYSFAELPPATVSGSTYLDANRNGVKDPNEFGIAHIVVTLNGFDDLGNPVTATATTADDGSYSFNGLRPGVYAVTETLPGVFGVGKPTLGANGGTVCCDNQVTGIPVRAGSDASGYNFGLTPKAGCKLDPRYCKLETPQMQAWLRQGPLAVGGMGRIRASVLANLNKTIPRISYFVPTLAQRIAAGTSGKAAANHVVKAKAVKADSHAKGSAHVKAASVGAKATPKGPRGR